MTRTALPPPTGAFGDGGRSTVLCLDDVEPDGAGLRLPAA